MSNLSSIHRGSVMSVGSRLTLGMEEEPNYEEMSIEELRDALEQAIRTNRTLILENDVFERYLMRHDPQCLETMAQVLESARRVQRVASQLAPISSALSLTGSMATQSGRRATTGTRSPSIVSTQTFTGSRRFTPSATPKNFRISISHRIEMVNKEIENMKTTLRDLEQLAIKTRRNLKAQMEEIDLRIRETYEAKAELEQNVVQKGIDPLTGKIPAEKFVRFMEEWMKAANNVIEKLRLKSSTMKSQIKKAKQLLIQREELGESLHAIDFEQLAIENEDYARKIEEKTHYLLELKKIAGRYSLQYNSWKQKLNEQVSELNNIKKSIALKQHQIEKLQNVEKVTRGEANKANEQLQAIIKLMDEYTVPDVLDFVKVQAELREMKKTYKRMERHREIQAIAIKSYKKQIEMIDSNEEMRRQSEDIGLQLETVK